MQILLIMLIVVLLAFLILLLALDKTNVQGKSRQKTKSRKNTSRDYAETVRQTEEV